ncbi:MAG: uracil-DNA glycosylase [Proteobacteria bacterium]|jgi:uracil-DNA glycosylase family 4|nr:MAG: uracil-DNA glycosylase [Pseudomonadota bacterium]|tara:strand:- start:1039 stop:1758 length:720 start_codon:yes stop_codon:yes gene_type:complete
MIKNKSDHSLVYTDEFINTIEQDFVFSNKPINRFKVKLETTKNQNAEKKTLLEELKKNINSIENCNLKSNSNHLILGDGKPDSPIMLIGEAPSAIEDESGKTFQGEVGTLLDKMLLAIEIKRDSIYLSYAINFRPPEDRKPTSQEIKRYSIFLKKHISIIDPKLIIVMGSSAMEALTGSGNKISKERGNWKEIILDNKTYPMMISFNPSYLIRFPENKKYSWEDLKKIRDKIKELKIKL